VRTLAEAIEDHWSTWAPHGGPVVDRLLFGVDRADEVAAIVSAWCATNLGSPVAVGHRWMTSVGSVAVVDLVDGRAVVVKVHQPDRDPRFLRAVQAVQRAVASAGIACPRPLAAPAPIGSTGSLAVADTLLADPGLTDGRAPGAVVAAASTLADAIVAAEAVDVVGLPVPSEVPAGRLWPRPHSPVFDFEGTAAGAEWIEAVARRARDVRDRPVEERARVAHTDWCSRNVRVVDGTVVAAYDWDAVTSVTPSIAVGQAAALWPCTGEPDSPPASSPTEVRTFVDAYDAAATAPLSGPGRRRAAAAALYTLAYSARCEHAIGRVGGSGTEALREHGDAYLHALD